MSYASNVYYLLLNRPLLQIMPPTATPQVTIPSIGQQEHIPEFCFVATALPTDNGFIQQAFDYHNTYGFSPVSITSLQELLEHSSITGSSDPITRLRIVTHADFNNMFIELFNGTTRGILKEQLSGFGVSDVEGLKATIKMYNSNDDHFSTAADKNRAITHFQSTNVSLLTPVELNTAGSTPSPEVNVFLRRCMDRWYVLTRGISFTDGTNTTAITNAQRTTLRTSLDTILEDAKQAVISSTSANDTQLSAIITATESLTLADLNYTSYSGGTFDANLPIDLAGSNSAIAGGIRAKITHLQARISENTTIDIRGCRVGQTTGYLQSVREFFGRPSHLPTVTGPEWFQSFPTSFGTFGAHTHIQDLWDNGEASSNITSADVSSAFSTWASEFNFNPVNMYFESVFNGNLFDFASLRWRRRASGGSPQGIPLLNLPAADLDNITSQSLGDIIHRFAGYYQMTMPNATNRNRLSQLQPHLLALIQTEINIAATSSPTSAELTGFHTELLNLANQITGISGFPTPSSSLVANPAPAGLTLANINMYASNIRNHCDNILSTHLNAYFTTLNTRFSEASNPLKLFLNLGLPLFVQSSSTPSNYNVFLWHSHSVPTFKTMMKIQWTGTSAQIQSIINTIDNLSLNVSNSTHQTRHMRLSRLTEDRLPDVPNTEAAFCPLPDFQARIKTTP